MINKIQRLSRIPLRDLNAYIHTINTWKMLSSTEEQILSEKLYYHGDLMAAKTIILSHLRFVVHIAQNYSGYGLPQSDLIQEGNVGLMKAVRRFNPNMNVRIVSFAVHWIKSEIHEYVLKNWRIVKVATTKSQRKLFFNLRKKKNRLSWFNENEVRIVSQELRVTQQDVRDMESRMLSQDITFNPIPELKIQDLRISNLLPYLHDYKSNFSHQVSANNWNKRASYQLNHAILRLDSRSRHIIHARWLIDKKNKITLQEIANNYGISAERVRQLEKNAMKKLKGVIKN
ncbi:RNA polymerase sigma factor RpoH [Buchnera aphidicola (Phyllaphis fagi)]|uniref:RNA polymerase sigma factor RpoH n=1 Tax=Buchnera aphidicola TaxID=9 RepID=UPI0034648CCD